MRIVMIGPFGLRTKSTMRERALPMARSLVKRGHSVLVLVPPWDSPEDAGRSWIDAGVEIVNTSLPSAGGLRFHLQLTNLLVQHTLDAQPDVIHFFKPKAYAGLAHVLLHSLKQLKQHRARLVVDTDDDERAWNEVNDYSRGQKAFFAWQEPWGLRHADSITVASKALYQQAVQLRVPSYRIRYVPNGVRPMQQSLKAMKTFPNWQEELALVASAQANCLGLPLKRAQLNPFGRTMQDCTDYEGRIRARYGLFGQPVVLVYTRFVEYKVPMLAAVIEGLAKRMPKAHWLIVGKGYFGEENDLALHLDTVGLSEKVTLAGWVPQEELPYYFAAANVAFHPYDDTPINRAKCSVRLLDLLSTGVPVVASQVGQNGEYILHNQTGYLVPPGNVEAAVEALALIAGNQALQRKLSQRAACYTYKMFSWDTLVDRVEAAYAI